MADAQYSSQEIGKLQRGNAEQTIESVTNRVQTSPSHAYVGMGSNLADRAASLLLAIREMTGAGLTIRRLSSIYETEPLGVPDEQPRYLNLVAELNNLSLYPPEKLLQLLLEIESSLGRRRERRFAARTIDLDLLLYGNESRQTDALTLPHPRLHLRRFVLTPLAELISTEVHPGLGKSYAELLATCADNSEVNVWKPS